MQNSIRVEAETLISNERGNCKTTIPLCQGTTNGRKGLDYQRARGYKVIVRPCATCSPINIGTSWCDFTWSENDRLLVNERQDRS